MCNGTLGKPLTCDGCISGYDVNLLDAGSEYAYNCTESTGGNGGNGGSGLSSASQVHKLYLYLHDFASIYFPNIY